MVLEVEQIFPPDGRPKVRLGLKQVGIILWGTRVSALDSMTNNLLVGVLKRRHRNLPLHMCKHMKNVHTTCVLVAALSRRGSWCFAKLQQPQWWRLHESLRRSHQQMAWGGEKKKLIWTSTKSHRWFNDHFSFSYYLYGHIINWHTIFHLWGGSCVNRGPRHRDFLLLRAVRGASVKAVARIRGGNHYADCKLFLWHTSFN